MTTHEEKEKGFMLLEVVAATAVLTILLLGLSATYSTALLSEQTAHYNQIASEYGQTQLEEVLNSDFADIPSWDGQAFHVPTRYGTLEPASNLFYPLATDDSDTTEDESDMAGHITVVSDPDGNGSPELLEVTVTVAYQDSRGEDRRVDFVARTTEQP